MIIKQRTDDGTELVQHIRNQIDVHLCVILSVNWRVIYLTIICKNESRDEQKTAETFQSLSVTRFTKDIKFQDKLISNSFRLSANRQTYNYHYDKHCSSTPQHIINLFYLHSTDTIQETRKESKTLLTSHRKHIIGLLFGKYLLSTMKTLWQVK